MFKCKNFGLGLLLISSYFLLFSCQKTKQHEIISNAHEILEPWQKGILDIHHINTASGDVTFFIFPDGTTMLFDLGAMKPLKGNPEYFSLKTNSQFTPAQIVAHYIQATHPDKKNTHLNYALISHFHEDHYGKVDEESEKSENGEYLLSGITEIDKYVPIDTLIDRAYPEYNEPRGLTTYYSGNATFNNYLKFVDFRNNNNKPTEFLEVGSNNQITLKSDDFPEFEVRNLKANLSIWSGKGDNTNEKKHDFSKLIENCGFNENPFSLALKINYGDFDYYTGGDLTGYDWRNVLDMETPIAKVIGETDVITMNHHGFHDATNEYFMKTLSPQVVINQSRHTPHFQFTPLQQVVDVKSDFFVNNLHDEIFDLFSTELKDLVRGMNGHILVRVRPGGAKYDMYVLEDDNFDMKIIKKIGPYLAEK
ncbi:hypothetical protein [Maribacter sp. 2304DJ31-5]|uniref:hypothetical protein n=1 Tax=Maribacter sp. 2304DJ31-5 TaxID=3386273 RepID=UPI0039BD04CE